MTDKELEEYKAANKIETVDVKGDQKIREAYNNYANYLMIVLMVIVQIGISVLSALDGDIADAFPHTQREWIIWILLRVINAVIAFMIFDSFVKEGEKAGKQSEQYKAANERFMDIFCANVSKEIKTISPSAYLAKTRGLKAIKLVGGAVLTGVAVSLSTITLDWSSLLGTLMSIAMMIVWGYQKKLEVENYFVNDYPIYVAVEEHKLYAAKQDEIMLLKQNTNDNENVGQIVNIATTEDINKGAN